MADPFAFHPSGCILDATAQAREYTTTMFVTGNNTGIPVPPEVLDALGGGKRPAVNVTVNGYSFRGTVGSMGGQYLISFNAARRAESGIGGGDPLDVTLSLDTASRAIEPPSDFAEALLEAPTAHKAFLALAPSHQKAHVAAIESAKTDATRQRRIAAAVEKLALEA